MVDKALRIRALSKTFAAVGAQGSCTALDRIDLDLEAGQFLAVVGPSGSGKSTLLDCIAGFERPSAGTIDCHGDRVRGPAPDRVVVFQDHAIFPWFTALGNVAYGLRRQGLRRGAARHRARAALEHMGLGAFAHAYPAALSGGMRQRVALARAWVLRPRLLLLDEPFAALDAGTRIRLQDDLLALWTELGCSVVFVTHTISEAVHLADRVVVLRPPPLGICADRTIGAPRPRDRRDSALGVLAEELTQALGEGDEPCACALGATQHRAPHQGAP
ncbi:MAG: ABC transporter ATP-binding protein [Planctomycetota bacterium]